MGQQMKNVHYAQKIFISDVYFEINVSNEISVSCFGDKTLTRRTFSEKKTIS